MDDKKILLQLKPYLENIYNSIEINNSIMAVQNIISNKDGSFSNFWWNLFEALDFYNDEICYNHNEIINLVKKALDRIYMIDFSRFYNDTYFIYALFKENYLTIDDIKKITDKLTLDDDNKYLIDILISEDNNDVITSFENYFKDKNITVEYSKIEITKKIFLYILCDKISMKEGIDFIHYHVEDPLKYKKFVGDDLGIEKILSNYFLIDDGDIIDKNKIQKITEEIINEMKEYIQKHD